MGILKDQEPSTGPSTPPPEPPPDEAPPAEPEENEARQAEPALSPWRALRWGTALAAVLLLAILLYFVVGYPGG
jgi:hypothetical protein